MSNNHLPVAIIEPVGSHGGAHYYDYALADGLAKNGAEVYFFTSDETKEIKYPGVTTVYSFAGLWKTKSSLKRFTLYIKGLYRSLTISKARQILLVHFQVYQLNWLFCLTYLLTKIRGFKIAVTLHDIDSFYEDKLPSYLEKTIVYGIDLFIVHNQFSFDEITKKYPDRTYHVIKHGNYLPFVHRVGQQKHLGNNFQILFFGQIKKVKGLDILLDAMHILKRKGEKIHLKVIGKIWKHDADIYSDFVRNNGLEDYVELQFKYIPDEEIWDLFNNTNLIVLPYKRIYQSGVLVMAMSYGRAILTSDLPPFKEIIVDELNGFTFKNGSPEDLASMIIYISECRRLLPSIEENAYQTMRDNFDWNIIGKETKKLYKAILKDNTLNSRKNKMQKY